MPVQGFMPEMSGQETKYIAFYFYKLLGRIQKL
jgi:hypothetical protein